MRRRNTLFIRAEEIPATAKFQNTLVGEQEDKPQRNIIKREMAAYEAKLDSKIDKNIKNSLVSCYKLTQ